MEEPLRPFAAIAWNWGSAMLKPSRLPKSCQLQQRLKLPETSMAALEVNQFAVFLMVNGVLLTMPTMTDEKR